MQTTLIKPKMLGFEVPGEPRSKARHRTTRGGIQYTPKETVQYENLVKMCFREQCGDAYLEGPIRAAVTVYMSIPQSASGRRKDMMEIGELRPTKKPDVDNIAKAILDSLNKIAYHDDSAVVECVVRKWYSSRTRVVVALMEGLR
jgi:Holliday junction resolvase RusA-like endonuclease